MFYQQVAIDCEAKIDDEKLPLLEKIKELEEKVERKEYFLQQKEKKWGEVEKILDELAIDDDDLKDELAKLRIYVLPLTKMSNVVTKNDELLNDLAHAYREIDHLRNVFLDPFARKKKIEIEMKGKA